METNRRRFVQITSAGLLQVSSRPLLADESPQDVDLLIRRAAERGHTDLGWLKSYHSFSFGGYVDQQHMGFRSLRVINDDRITPGRGFPTHPHRDMEILSYVLDGSLQHRDSTGQGSIVRPDDVQMMTAGRGITHSEYNPSRSQENHFLQIWIKPAQRRLDPQYQQHKVEASAKLNTLRPIAAPDAAPGVVRINQDARVYATNLRPNAAVAHNIEQDRHGWLQVARGELSVNGVQLGPGDAVATSKPTNLHIQATTDSEALLFDLG